MPKKPLAAMVMAGVAGAVRRGYPGVENYACSTFFDRFGMSSNSLPCPGHVDTLNPPIYLSL